MTVNPSTTPLRIISGGQTGVDRAALDVAAELGLERGGWCPLGRKAEDGPIPEDYPLEETPSARYAERTRWNVRDSDATLILTLGPLAGGSALAEKATRRFGKPCLVIDLTDPWDPAAAARWIKGHAAGPLTAGSLNIAGPRESQHPGLYDRAADYLRSVLAAVPEP
ncbi:MAG: putative molybdenum carrier protein [Planctomycetes bacterium]|nr:putative molybdenum carrier protein [Planctomycetota bacterium]